MCLTAHIVEKSEKEAEQFMDQTEQQKEEILRLREISNENQKKVNGGIFLSEKQENPEKDQEKHEEGEGKRHGIVQGVIFLALAAVLLGQARENETVEQVMSQIGKTIEEIGEKIEERQWFSPKTDEEEKESQSETNEQTQTQQ